MTMTATRDLSQFVRHLDGGVARMELEVDGLLRAGCTQTIEGGLAAIPDITLAHVSLADRRVAVEWRDGKVDPVRFIKRLSELGYEAHPCDVAASADGPAAGEKQVLPALLRRAGVAALAAVAVRLLPALVWPEAAAGITPEQRDIVHGLSAMIAVSAAAWAGGPIFAAAVRAAAAGRLSREAPLSAGIALAFGLSAVGTFGNAVPASYDVGLALLAALLAVHALELAAQQRVPAFAGNPASRPGETVTRFVSGTELADVPADSIRSGDLVLVRPGERIAVDGVVTEGRSEIDQSGVTGETLPASIARDGTVYAGTRNISRTLRVRVSAPERGALPDGVPRRSGRTGDAGCARLSDRVTRLYPPVVLAAALITLIGRMAFGATWQEAAMAAVAVLAMTHPATFGLAVATADAWAARALFRTCVLLKSADGVDRLAQVDTILFDKTGTLTLPDPEVVDTTDIPPERLAVAGRLALTSRHPLAAAVARAAGATEPIPAIEEPGQGVRCILDGVPLRLGRPSFCDAERRAAAVLETDPEASVIAFAHGAERYVLAVRQQLRSDAIETVAQLKQDGFAVELLSGDRAPAVAHAADTLGIERWCAGMTPTDKTGRIAVLQACGRTVLMVGDGRNDASALAAADAAMSTGTAAPSVLAAADAVFTGGRLAPVPAAILIARRARRLRRQNLLVAAITAAVVTPLAVAGLASPLAAAGAMAGVAVVVTLNALRPGWNPNGPGTVSRSAKLQTELSTCGPVSTSDRQ
jgi:Cu2+-exporting ATPase